ncbi:cystatin C (amyloid angiopathy and cerebral hemorrhage) [Micropterus dolomieu]|uniref:cystatin C (amyloid angiopathy and cerebral hemorrhage) n=1 Tax=Micropterus dolomieu TaxID=147949 RepID=UPI001E8E73E4|nr:cystatin C (amyloid angiopathy and cerebral hemorrhage) [Micropterus dolomieu]
MWKIVFTVLAAVLAVGLGGLVGGFQDTDVNDEGLRNALNFAVVQHNRGNNDMYLSQVAEVVKVQRQVVAGSKYIITVRMAKTPCRKDSANEVCAIHEDPAQARPYECTFEVWSRPWLNDIRLLKEEC